MPDWAHEVRSRLSSLRLSPTREAEIVDELSQHLDDRYRELIAGGAHPDDAVRVTLADFRSGNVLAQHLAQLRQTHVPASLTPGAPTAHMLAALWHDLRYAARMFRKQPVFAASAVATLALGIGATAAIFSVVYGVLLKPLPFAEPARLVVVGHNSPDGIRNHGPATYFTYRDNQRVFEDIGAWDRNQVTITGSGDPEQIDVLSVSDATLPLLRVQPLLGRLFTKEDDSPGRPRRAILTYGYWQRRFGGDTNVVGHALVIDGAPAEIIGVLPSSFKFPSSSNAMMLLPLQLDPAAATGISFGFQVLARLKPGVTISQANGDIGRMIGLLPRSFEVLKLQPNVRSQAAYVIGNIGDILWILFGAVGMVLLIACGNVANLFLVRAEGRQQELALRAALGASRGRLASVLLSESVLLALVGGAVGVVLAKAIVTLLRQLAPAQLPRVDEIGVDLTVLLFTFMISIVSGALFGLIAVLKFGQPSATALKEGGRSVSDAPGRHRARNALVVAQVALALALMIVSGLMIRTFVAMRQVNPGFARPDAVQTFRLSIPEGLISDPQQVARTHQRIAERIAQVPGVVSVGLASSITMDGEDNGNSINLEEFPVPDGTPAPLFRFKTFAPGYFETMGNRLVAGHSITWADVYERRPVILVSENLARKYWKDPAAALGQRVRTSSERPWREIVGVVGDERDDGLNHAATPIVYWPLLNDSYQEDTIAYAVRSARVGTAAFQRELEQAVWSVNANLPLAAVETLAEIQARSMAQTSFTMVMLAIAAGVALVLGVVGIVGVITYIATERTREIGIRLALGAQIEDVRQMFLRHGLSLTAAGIALGIAVAMALTRVTSALLFGVGPMDPTTYAAVSATLAAVALLATYLPACRAAQVDPIVALRADV
jgi:putative ABC transport system permease protein